MIAASMAAVCGTAASPADVRRWTLFSFQRGHLGQDIRACGDRGRRGCDGHMYSTADHDKNRRQIARKRPPRAAANLMAAESGGCRGEAQPRLACGTAGRRQRDRHHDHGEDVDRARVEQRGPCPAGDPPAAPGEQGRHCGARGSGEPDLIAEHGPRQVRAADRGRRARDHATPRRNDPAMTSGTSARAGPPGRRASRGAPAAG